TLPAFTVMVLTLTGVIASPEPGFGARERTAPGCVAAAPAPVATDAASSAVSSAEEETPTGPIASARAKRCSNGVFGCSAATAAFGSATIFGSAKILGSATTL